MLLLLLCSQTPCFIPYYNPNLVALKGFIVAIFTNIWYMYGMNSARLRALIKAFYAHILDNICYDLWINVYCNYIYLTMTHWKNILQHQLIKLCLLNQKICCKYLFNYQNYATWIDAISEVVTAAAGVWYMILWVAAAANEIWHYDELGGLGRIARLTICCEYYSFCGLLPPQFLVVGGHNIFEVHVRA